MVQNLRDRNRIPCLPVDMVLHLILLLQTKVMKSMLVKSLSNRGNALRLHKWLREFSLKVQRNRTSEHRIENTLSFGLHWPSLLLSVNMEQLFFCCFLCCFYMPPAIANHFVALMLQQ